MTEKIGDGYKFAKHSEECEPAKDQERLNHLAVCIASQQAAGFRKHLDVRELNCATCGAPGFNTGWGYWEFSCRASVLSDGEADEPCPKEAVLQN